MRAVSAVRGGVILAVALASAALANEGRRGPPPEALTACEGKAAEQACEVNLGGRALPGTCAPTPDQRLACRPRPPPEAFAACQGKAASDACEVTPPGRGQASRPLPGECAAGPDAQLFCRPARPPPPPESFDACAQKAEGDACSVSHAERTLQGKCASTPDSRRFCRPNERPSRFHDDGSGPPGPPL